MVGLFQPRLPHWSWKLWACSLKYEPEGKDAKQRWKDNFFHEERKHVNNSVRCSSITHIGNPRWISFAHLLSFCPLTWVCNFAAYLPFPSVNVDHPFLIRQNSIIFVGKATVNTPLEQIRAAQVNQPFEDPCCFLSHLHLLVCFIFTHVSS